MKRCFSFLLALLLCLLSGCMGYGYKSRPVMYGYGGVWESDSNTVCTDSAVFIDHYTLPDGTVLTAEEGGKLVKVTCRARFAVGWRIAMNTSLDVPWPAKGGTLICEPIFMGNTQGGSTYVLLFELTSEMASDVSADYRWNLERYGMTLWIKESDAVQRSQAFVFMEY